MPVRQATYTDLSPAAHVLAAAFKDRPIMGQYLHPYREQYPEGMYLHFLRKLRLSYAQGPPDDYLLVSYDEKQSITGFAHWDRKRAIPLQRSWPKALLISVAKAYNYLESLIWPNHAIEPSRASFLAQIDPFIAHHWTGSRAEVWNLDLLAVSPDCEGRGYGRQLTAWGFEKAEQDGIGCSVLAALNKEGFYRSCGFEVAVGNIKDEGGDANPFVREGVQGGTVMFSK